MLRVRRDKIHRARLTSLKSLHNQSTTPSAIPALLPHIKILNTAEGVFIHETQPLSPADIRINKRWLHQHKQSLDARYRCSTEFRSYFLCASSSSSPSSNPDQEFVTKAAQGNSAEVELGKIVAAKSKDPNVKQFAQMMVKDHTTALNELQELAQTKNLNFNDDLPDDAKALQQKLSSDTGKQLDKDYMDGMVEDHQKDVQEFTDKSQNAKDPDVKQWASKTLPTLQKHLEKAQQIDAKLNKGKPSGTVSQR